MKERPVRLLSFWRSPWNCSLDRKGNTSSTRQVKKSIKFLLTEKRWTTYVFAQEGKRIFEYYIGISIKKESSGILSPRGFRLGYLQVATIRM